MEEKINIAEILKDKPVNTKLYSPLFGDVYFSHVKDSIINVEHHTGVSKFFNSGRYYNYDESEPLLFPSMEMRDWNKFSWKKGDVLVCTDGKAEVIFERFDDDNYTSFVGKHYLESYGKDGDLLDYEQEHFGNTANYTKESDETVQCYINTIEERLGGKLNRETLEVEKAQPEFKDGDIVTQGVLKGVNVCIIKNCIDKIDNKYNCYARYNTQDKQIDYADWSYISPFAKFATDSEKQQLFEALAKEGKAWDAKKKMIVYLKPKYEFKPMDLCLMKYIGQYNNRGWELCQYAYTEHRVSSSGEHRDFYHAVGGEIYAECIPYNEDTKHLLGTKDKWKGGEG